MACAASAGFGWKNGNLCKNAATFVSGPVWLAFDSEKSPFSSAGVNVLSLGLVWSRDCRWLCQPLKKNNLSFIAGPPSVPPN